MICFWFLNCGNYKKLKGWCKGYNFLDKIYSTFERLVFIYDEITSTLNHITAFCVQKSIWLSHSLICIVYTKKQWGQTEIDLQLLKCCVHEPRYAMSSFGHTLNKEYLFSNGICSAPKSLWTIIVGYHCAKYQLKPTYDSWASHTNTHTYTRTPGRIHRYLTLSA